MYEIRPETIKTFVLDRNIKLPRFQRKQTWDEKKNFQLCISLFKEYPMGVTILSVEEIKGRTIRWLLDGRQRRNALLQMYEDPENIYNWAKKFIGFKNSNQPSELEELFWKKTDEYIEYSEEDEVEIIEEDSSEDNSEGIESEDEECIDQKYGLEFLLEIIKIIHNKNKKNTGFTKPFDFTKYVSKLPYLENNQGVEKLSSRKLKTFLDEYRNNYCTNEDLEFEKEDSFFSFIDSRCQISDKNNLKRNIASNWKEIMIRISILERLDNLLSNSKIGLIEVKKISPADSQKIFNIINQEGEKLSAVEVLSAKPSWNTKIENAPIEMERSVKELYKKIGTENTNIVKWDLPATFLRRIGNNIIIKEFKNDPKDFSKEITYGFKILAGIWEDGVKKEDIEKLSKKSISWSYEYEQLVSDISSMLKLINTFSYFKFFKSWRTNIMELTSDSIALNFFILMYNDWVKKGKPIGSDIRARQFEKNCLILWDKLIYEYLSSQWKGSGDSKIASNIAAFKKSDDLISPIPTEKWIQLLEEIRDNYSVFDNRISNKTNFKALLYHFYCLKSISGPDTLYSIEIDHILPQDLFKNSVIPEKESKMNSIYNYGLLPKNDNISKGKKRLIEITDSWLIDQIEKYEFVKPEQFPYYSDLSNYEKIYESRFDIFKNAFDELRTRLLNN